MPGIKVFGTEVLKGEISIHGSKNAVLPILAAAVLCKGTSVIKDCPQISDVFITIEILRYIGCTVDWSGNDIIVDTSCISGNYIPSELLDAIRSSITFIGPLIGRTGGALMSYPGGCSIGTRPIDLHLYALRQLNATIVEQERTIQAYTEKLIGSDIIFPFPSVGATQNAIMAAVLAEGVTNIYNGAKEPEVCMLIEFLNCMGADIKADASNIMIKGVKALHGCEYSILGDRIVAATYMAAVAGVGGSVIFRNVNPEYQTAFLNGLQKTGCCIMCDGTNIKVCKNSKTINAVEHIITAPYPGFPTDMQSQMVALLSKADGVSRVTENIFENRFKVIESLNKMGADIYECSRNTLKINGVYKLHGASVNATDLRGSAAIVVAGLMAEGETTLDTTKYIQRGYEDIVRDLQLLGAHIMYAD